MTIEQLFFLIITCVTNGTEVTIPEVCTTPDATEIPYESSTLDPYSPIKIDNGYWYKYKISNTKHVLFEILTNNGEILQSGVEILYPPEAELIADSHYKDLSDIVTKKYGKGKSKTILDLLKEVRSAIPPEMLSTLSPEMIDSMIETAAHDLFNKQKDYITHGYENNKTVFYFTKHKRQDHTMIFFRAGNKKFWSLEGKFF
jgi:hypothetical protein